MAYPYYQYGYFNFQTVMQQWASIGLFDIVLPIVLIFTLVYSILQRTRVLGGRREIDSIVSLVIGFFAISNPFITGFFIPLFSNAAIGIAILLVFMLIMGLVNIRIPKAFDMISLFGGIAVFFWVLSRAADYFGGYIIFSGQWWTNNLWWVVPAALFGILMFLVVGGGEGEKTVGQKFQEIMSAPTWKEYGGYKS